MRLGLQGPCSLGADALAPGSAEEAQRRAALRGKQRARCAPLRGIPAAAPRARPRAAARGRGRAARRRRAARRSTRRCGRGRRRRGRPAARRRATPRPAPCRRPSARRPASRARSKPSVCTCHTRAHGQQARSHPLQTARGASCVCPPPPRSIPRPAAQQSASGQGAPCALAAWPRAHRQARRPRPPRALQLLALALAAPLRRRRLQHARRRPRAGPPPRPLAALARSPPRRRRQAGRPGRAGAHRERRAVVHQAAADGAHLPGRACVRPGGARRGFAQGTAAG